ncbi:probable KEX2-endoproteinase of late golgi compartment [Serendipita indica DSM 11827]|uniref:Probable KEX2-endoproteinase of late golgi compartment n=1 Tax=Serendipita indica (strain DSM 11827) TaxID=1109443 RepID=G4TAV0_SERID|nr:probable KEX2-endoproteinase of late golgi compartment [Serendipita indica DSM 11827]
MRLLGLLLFLTSPALLEASLRPAKRSYDTHSYYVIHHDPSFGQSPADSAAALGAELVEQVGELQDHYLVRYEKDSQPERTLFDAGKEPVTRRKNVLTRRHDNLPPSIRSLTYQTVRQRVKRAPVPSFPSVDKVVSEFNIHDPLFSSQWHIVNKEDPQHMVNVTGLWKEGITGKGVISALIDDGLDYTSEDLKANFYAPGSHDFNDHEDLPTPKLWDDKHGTRCAGEIAAVKNDVCGVGLAYDSKVAGIRILSGPISDADEAVALNFGFQESQIYSCSWGPPDSGQAMDGPNLIVSKAILNGINNGRGGKGSIFVFASGNGAAVGDSCNFDGYTNSIYTITVGAIDSKGLHPFYSEACAANLFVTYSSGSGKYISTTDVGEKCSRHHGGTSAAAPLAVGAFALALSVRPDLTWRDAQHIAIHAALHFNPEDPDWEMTASGRPYSYKYGYGKMDAYTLVHIAKSWQLVKPQVWMSLPTIEFEDAAMEDGVMTGGQPIKEGGVRSTTTITKAMLEENNFEKLEHITVKVWITHTRRGDVEVQLISPAGIKSVLGSRRPGDHADTGYPGWTFMTVKHWDENPIGQWTLHVFDQGNSEAGSILGWSMTLWGSAIDPEDTEKYKLPDDPNEGHNLPPHPTATTSTSKQHVKPTHHLPEDHGSQSGEATRPAFHPTGSKPGTAPTNSSSTLPTDEGVFTHMYDLMRNQLWLIGAFGIVIIFGVGAGVFLWRRRQMAKRAKGTYAQIPGDNMPMRSMEGQTAGSGEPGSGERSAGGTRELYDAFGVGSDDEDEADEHSALTGGGASRYVQQATVSYHDGFLDDEGLSTAHTARTAYRDEPGPEETQQEASHSPPREGSDGSWEDTSARA